MTPELQALWALHGLDEEIAQIQTVLARFPEQKSALEKRASGERTRLEAHQKAVAEVQKRRRDVEREIEGLGEQERKFLSQQASVKTNAEYQALTHQIQGVKDKRSSLETEVLLKMDEEERLASERPAIDAALKTAQAELDERARTIASEEAAEQTKLDALNARRAEALAVLPVTVRQRYERAHVSTKGRAVVAILKGACGGCYRNQSPQTMQEARRRDRVLVCDGCGRILVWPPEAA